MDKMFLLGILIVCSVLTSTTSGSQFCSYRATCYRHVYRSCGFWGWSRCGYTQAYGCSRSRCCPGWKDGPTGNCNTPICVTPCYNGGTCIEPDTCQCPTSHDGRYCQTLLCSHLSPCFPGTCSYPDNCACLKGFGDADSGCLKFTSDNNYPVINNCEITLAHIRRKDKKELFYFNFPCSSDKGKDTVWSNQELFNYVNFTVESQYHPIEYIPPQPSYVSDHKFGITKSQMHLVHSKYPRDGGSTRFIAFNHFYTCPRLSSTGPETGVSSCNITEENYKINIEHDDIMTVTYSSTNGGYRKLYDIDNRGYFKTETYVGQTTEKPVEFRFDFIAPVHCSEYNATVKCMPGEEPIYIDADITNEAIKPRWSGWSDGLSGISYFFLEIFELKPNIHGELTELYPLKPVFNQTLSENDKASDQFLPNTSGMYSILLRASDRGNNSKIARRLVLFDNESKITLTKPGFQAGKPANVSEMSIGDGGMHVISAIPETGYLWQTSEPGTKTHIILDWSNHFVNELHRSRKLLNKVIPYPTQFADLEDSGILRSKKYVALDDNEGSRTINPIPNINGIVKFEIKRVFTDDREVPTGGWEPHPLRQQYEIREDLDDGSHVRLWVRATDIMNNTLADYTEIHIDNTGPRVANERMKLNIVNATFTYTSRITFVASDDGSGVHKLDFKLFAEDGQELYREENVMANRNNASDACEVDPNCNCVLNTCFLREQTIDIDNCWFLVHKNSLNKSAHVVVNVYNQALLAKELTFNITRLSGLHGLEEYSGPSNIRLESNQGTGVRLVWDLPKTASCYGRADITIILVKPDGSIRVVNIHNEGTSVDLVGLVPDNKYGVSLKLGYRGNDLAELKYSFKTAKQDNNLKTAVIVGIAVSVGILIAAIVIVLLRRGHMPEVQQRGHRPGVHQRGHMPGVTQRGHMPGVHQRMPRAQPDTDSTYEEIDFADIQSWEYKSEDVVLESLLKSGSFANIYLATLKRKQLSVVAKTLKEGFSEKDANLMKSKIKFSSMQVGHHKNIVNFEGAVVSDSEIGSFIIYEYCSNGQLNEYLKTLTIQNTIETFEILRRFGLGILTGMEYLAERQIVHRRLGARNILLDDELEVKIAGFGPQPDSASEDLTVGKRERIPIKWTAPECWKSTVGATEKSDVWSYGIVLWEIFSLGDSPYRNIKIRDLLMELKYGYRLPKPEQCDEKWYSVMINAWAEEPEDRPTFSQIRNELNGEFSPAPQDDYYYP